MAEKSNAELALRIRRGDKAAFELLFRRHYARLCSFANRYAGRLEKAEDIVQEVFVKLWNERDTLSYTEGIQPYLYRAVRNRCLNHLKHLSIRREAIREIRYLDERSFPDSTYDGPSLEELEERIAAAITDLPEKCREIFLLSRNDGLTYKEIADVLDISVKTVETQVGRALKKMKERLSDCLPLLVLLLGYVAIAG